MTSIKDRATALADRFYDWPDRPYDDLVVAILEQLIEVSAGTHEACALIAYRYGCIDARDAIRKRSKKENEL
jgi:hypothetical protein